MEGSGRDWIQGNGEDGSGLERMGVDSNEMDVNLLV